MAHVRIEEIKPMTEEVMRDLVSRYYTTLRGIEPPPQQVEAIIRFARGLPMVVTISQIPEGILLVQAEHNERRRELGDKSPQVTVVERIEMIINQL
jgi:hypothetical protein